MKEKEFVVIGIDDNTEPDFKKTILEIIAGATVFSGGKRHHSLVEPFLPINAKWIDITVPLDDVFEKYAMVESCRIVVFASGDPLFFGFAVTLQKRLPEVSIRVYPKFNSLQTLSHRLVIPYDDMRIVSLTGRVWHEFDRSLIERADKIGILTDGIHTPASIAARALDYGYSNYIMFVGERLGGKMEQIGKYLLTEAVNKVFTSPNCIIMQRVNDGLAKQRMFGIPENLFMPLEGRVKMITKMPIRLLSLSMLNLYNCKSLWDIGFCTGSVSIEAKMQFPHIKVAAFEIREEGQELMNINSKRFGTPGIDVFIGDFTTLNLDNITPPDAVFIGGHGGKLIEIIDRVYHVLGMGGRIVFNSVSKQSNNLFMQGIMNVGMELIATTLITIDEYNTIEVMTAQKCPKE